MKTSRLNVAVHLALGQSNLAPLLVWPCNPQEALHSPYRGSVTYRRLSESWKLAPVIPLCRDFPA